MNTTINNKRSAEKNRRGRGNGKARTASRMETHGGNTKAIDRQIAEIDRTFTDRWEW